MLRVPAYPAALKVSETVAGYFARRLADARARGKVELAAAPDAATVEAVINTAFWASLRREEGYAPKISLAFLPPEQAEPPLRFARTLPLDAAALAKLAPAVERPGIHLGVWRSDCGEELCVWGTTRTIPRLCFVLEVVEPGLLVVKYRRGRDPGKFANVAVLRGDEVKVVDEAGASLPDCPELLNSLLGFGPSSLTPPDAVNVLVQLAVSMRAHGRGGALLVVPSGLGRVARVDTLAGAVHGRAGVPRAARAAAARRDGGRRPGVAGGFAQGRRGGRGSDGGGRRGRHQRALGAAGLRREDRPARGRPASRACDVDRAGRRLGRRGRRTGTARRDAPPLRRAVRTGSARLPRPRRLAGRPLHRLRMVALRRHGSRPPRRDTSALARGRRAPHLRFGRRGGATAPSGSGATTPSRSSASRICPLFSPSRPFLNSM